MKNNAVKRLYDKVVSKVLRAASRAGELPGGFGALDTRHAKRYPVFMYFALTWGVEHLRAMTMAEQLKYVAVLLETQVKGGEAYGAQFVELLDMVESRLMALDAVLEQVCEEQGFSPEEVRRVSGVDPFTPLLGSTTPNRQYQQRVKTLFNELFSRVEGMAAA